MELKPLKLIKSISQSLVDEDWLTQWPFSQKAKPSSAKKQASGSHITYSQQKLYYKGEELNQVIQKALQSNPQFLSKLAKELEKFKKERIKITFEDHKKKKLGIGQKEHLNKLLSLSDAYLTKITEKLKNRYDQTQAGIQLYFDDEGQLILNGMNLNMFILQCRDYPTTKSRLFLKGIKSRLHHILRNQANSRNHERVHNAVLGLFEKIDVILQTTP